LAPLFSLQHNDGEVPPIDRRDAVLPGKPDSHGKKIVIEDSSLEKPTAHFTTKSLARIASANPDAEQPGFLSSVGSPDSYGNKVFIENFGSEKKIGNCHAKITSGCQH